MIQCSLTSSQTLSEPTRGIQRLDERNGKWGFPSKGESLSLRQPLCCPRSLSLSRSLSLPLCLPRARQSREKPLFVVQHSLFGSIRVQIKIKIRQHVIPGVEPLPSPTYHRKAHSQQLDWPGRTMWSLSISGVGVGATCVFVCSEASEPQGLDKLHHLENANVSLSHMITRHPSGGSHEVFDIKVLIFFFFFLPCVTWDGTLRLMHAGAVKGYQNFA